MDFRHRMTPLPLIDVLPTTPASEGSRSAPGGFPMDPELMITGDDFHKDFNRARSANGHPPIEGTKGNRRAGHARVQAWGAQNQPRQKGQEPQTGDRDRPPRGGRLQIREQGEEPPEPEAYQSSRAAWCDRGGPQRARERAGIYAIAAL